MRPDGGAAAYCAAQVERLDPDRYFLAMMAPPDRRGDLMALYAFNQEVARVREQVSEPMLGQIRLQWWREAIEGIYAGAPRRHQVVLALAGAVARHDLPRAEFERLIDAREADLRNDPPASLDALESYAEATAATLARLASRSLGAASAEAAAAARAAGIAWALTGLLRAVAFHARAKRLYLPGDLLATHGVRAGDLFELRPAEGLPAVVAEVAERARQHIAAARAHRRAVARAALPVLLQARLAALYLERLRRYGYNPLEPAAVARPPSAALRLTAGFLLGRY